MHQAWISIYSLYTGSIRGPRDHDTHLPVIPRVALTYTMVASLPPNNSTNTTNYRILLETETFKLMVYWFLWWEERFLLYRNVAFCVLERNSLFYGYATPCCWLGLSNLWFDQSRPLAPTSIFVTGKTKQCHLQCIDIESPVENMRRSCPPRRNLRRNISFLPVWILQ